MSYPATLVRVSILLAAPLALATLPGCIIQDIRDDLRGVNERLDRVDTRLEELRVTNETLAQLENQLELLQSIDTSLKNLDVHLASLRETIGNIDSAIPFLKISGDEPADESQTEPQADTQTETGAQDSGDDSAGTTRSDTAPKPSDATPE